LEEAFRLAYDNLEEEQTYVKGLKSYFMEELKKVLPEVKFNGNCHESTKSTYTLLNVCLPFDQQKALMLLFHMDLKGIACSRGSACQSGSSKGSHVLRAILSDEDLEKPSLRFSFSKFNTKEEIDYVVQTLHEYAHS
jgi:cysteine desulfurase